MKIALLQLNYVVGNLEYNAEKIVRAVQSLKGKTDLCVTSELALTGYPPRDLLLEDQFIENVLRLTEEMAVQLKDYPALLLGCVTRNLSRVGKPLRNSAVFIENGMVKQAFHKKLLPTYDVFEEDRYFESGDSVNVLRFKNKSFGITICEDIWNHESQWSFPRYEKNPVHLIAASGVDMVLNLSASPFCQSKQAKDREPLMRRWAADLKVPFIYVNQVGGNDDLVFDGYSCVVTASGAVTHRAHPFQEDIIIANVDDPNEIQVATVLSREEEIYQALVCGTRDYLQKCGFKRAVLGLSGGIDSALTAAIAVDAIGAENVIGVLMPSPYSSQGSVDDALQLAKALNMKTHTLPIAEMMSSYDQSLAMVFAGKEKDITEENLQARIRGNLLMAVSNKLGALLLTTGNKSEISVGYCTIYGDMCGGLAVISDVYKTQVYRLAVWLNKFKGFEVIPVSTITKPPSAELRPDQCDQDSLPPYDVLDDILFRHIEQTQSVTDIVAAGHDRSVVEKVMKLFVRAEFKRRQAAPGLKTSTRAYGTGWRMPIASETSYLFSQWSNSKKECA